MAEPARLEWRGSFGNDEINRLHGEAFDHDPFVDWDWVAQVEKHSMGWVVARDDGSLVGFVNVLWDGAVHAWIQDVMVAGSHRGRGIGRRLVERATEAAREAGCEWLHVDFDDDLAPFYIDSCGFSPTGAGLIDLT